MTTVGEQLSVAETSPVKSGMTAAQLASAEMVRGAAQCVIVGGVAATTVTVKLQESPLAVAQVTVVVPTGNREPDSILQVTSGFEPQSPDVVGVG